jgi:stearoyl-CoA desaturase (delta-9 desaturase)
MATTEVAPQSTEDRSSQDGQQGYHWGAAVPFALIHLACLGVFFIPFHWSYVAWAAAFYLVRMFGVTAGYHRYFSHRSFKLNRLNQFLLAFLAETSAQKGVLWWAAHHRVHHSTSDTTEDIHSPRQEGFWWAHVGWVLSNDYDEYDPRLIQDFAKYPELRWLNKYFLVPPTILGALILGFGGLHIFLWGFVVSTVLLFHGTFAINSIAHVWGTRRFDTPDHSRNNFLLALITLGEGWHNNHHQYMYACRQGLRWWEIDITYYCLRGLQAVGIVKNIRAVRLPYQTPEPQ